MFIEIVVQNFKISRKHLWRKLILVRFNAKVVSLNKIPKKPRHFLKNFSKHFKDVSQAKEINPMINDK